ncbi:unnamed protein product, partial [Discosporangium mesarthrocarpum]
RYEPLGGTYLLVAYQTGTVVIWDTSKGSEITSFSRCTPGLVSARWMPWSPGNFLTLR